MRVTLLTRPTWSGSPQDLTRRSQSGNQSARKAQDASVADELDQIRRDLDQIGREAENAARGSSLRTSLKPHRI